MSLSEGTRAGSATSGAKSATAAAGEVAKGEQDFSLILGGPLFQLLRRTRLSDDALALVKKRIVVIALLAWLPLLLFSALQGNAFKGSVAVPFLLDWEVHVRFLVALPLLIGAELVVHQRMRTVIQLFRSRKIIPESEMPSRPRSGCETPSPRSYS